MPIALPRRSEVDAAVLGRAALEDLTFLSLHLYREARGVIEACARYHEPDKLADRPRAVCCGLIVRLTKFMHCVDALTSTLRMSADVVMALNRCMLESAVNVMFLLSVDDSQVYEDFVQRGLGPEREFYDLVQHDIAAAQGQATPMQERILRSILRLVQQSGFRIDDVPVRHQEWGGNMRERIDAIGWKGLYIPYRIGSHAVHGTWADVLMRHLVHEDGGFMVEWSLGTTDSRLLNAQAILNLNAAACYAYKWLRDDDQQVVLARMDNVITDLEAVSTATEEALNRN